MALLNWKADYCTGNAKIDEDHRALFERVNDFHFAWQQNRDRKDIARVLNRLVEYAEEHFAREEEIMRVSGYPGLARHQAIHEALFEQIFVLQGHFEDGRIRIDRDTVDFLRGWLVDHIVGEDMKFAAYVESGDEPAPARQASEIDVV